MIGFLLTYGYWACVLYRLHGNPFFPYFNQIFHSPDALPLAHTDGRFRPASLVEILLIPLRLLRTNRLYSELLLRDPRLLLGVVGSVALYVSTFRRGADTAARLLWRRRVIAGFFFISLLVWAGQYGIYRYVLPLEMLACMTAVVATQWLPLPRPWRNLLLIFASLLVVHVTVHPKWGRVDFTRPMLQVRMPVLSPDSMVVISSESPLAFAVTALPDDVPAISIANNFMRPDRCTNLQADAERRIAGHTGPLWLLRGDTASDDDGERTAGHYYGLFASAPCLPVVTSLAKLRLCPMQRRPVPAICASAIATTSG